LYRTVCKPELFFGGSEMVLLFSPANVITMINIYKQLSICLNKDYVWALYLLNMIEYSLVCQSTLISCSSVRSVMNILRRWTYSFMYSNVNNLKNLHVANLPNYGNNYYQNVKMLAKRKSNKKKSNDPRHPASVKFQPKLRPCLWHKSSISPSLPHPKARPYMNIHPIMNHMPSPPPPPVIHSDLIRRRNFRFPFPMKNVFTPRILIWCPYIAFYFNAYLTGVKTILSSSISNHSDHEVPMRCMF
jgi:hypothetical protein